MVRVDDLVAVTGAEGFIGSHLVEALVARGQRVRGMVLYNAFGSTGWLATLSADVLARVEIMPGDVRDPGSVDALLDGVSRVYHLAALIGIPYSYRAPQSYLATNAAGTMNVLEAARRFHLERIVHTSTSEVYGTARRVPIAEDHPLQAQSPYSASKVAADALAQSYHLSFDLPVVTLRPFNTFGPRQSARAVIPTIISQILAGRSEVKLGATSPTRDFTFVTDTAAAFVAVGEAPAQDVVGHIFNAGTGREISIGHLVTLISGLAGRSVSVAQDTQRLRPDDSEVMRLVCDSSKLRAACGWGPVVKLNDGLTRTLAWMSDSNNLASYDVDRYSV